ncbi:hypothetical protein MtrunA17_Chr6g0458651 [Medicago truncatula]|uniref:Uncharacterized protein n=1 Tax=Medicago truncatula TaxID=3880 RepID=A0A396HB87_MEDTR|nr:hypothetical protein MtrunA17_Chr6g0458651 [Medicago truncatula]
MLGSHPLTHHLTHSNRSPHPIFYFPFDLIWVKSDNSFGTYKNLVLEKVERRR